jgi:hypothetical protein
MAESIFEQALLQIKDDIEGIVADGGSTYWYRPDRVDLVTFFEDRMLDSSHDYIVLIRPGDENHEEKATNLCVSNSEVYILVSKRFELPTEFPPDESAPSRLTVVNRMVRDVLRSLWTDVQLGGLVENIAVEPILVDREREVEGWAMAEIRLVLRYDYVKETP